MWWLWIVGGVILLIGAYFWLVVIAFNILFRRPLSKKIYYFKPFFGDHFNKHSAEIEAVQTYFTAKEHEDVYVVSNTAKLHARFYENPKSNKIVIFVHGYYSYGLHDIGYVGKIHEDLGVSLLLVDERACGESEGKYTSLGILERFDIREWIFYLNARFNGEKEIYLHGVSMGAATSLLVTGLPGLPPSFKGVIADCGFSRTNGVMLFAGNRLLKIRPKMLMWGINILARLFAGFNLNSVKVSSELKKNTTIPILFIHGTIDRFVPYNMSVKNYKSVGVEKKKLVSIYGAEHCESYLVDRDLYLKEVRRFIYEEWPA